MAGGGGNLESGEPDFQIAPMIDVLLVMLIFFMTITSAQVLRVDKNIQLPTAPNALKKDSSRSEAIVNVRWDVAKRRAVFTFDERIFQSASDLVPDLRKAREASEKQRLGDQSPSYRVLIRADRESPALYVSHVMHAAAEAGISDISFSTVNRE